jgi:RimJ/RimL family protein N-acetyltransferase
MAHPYWPLFDLEVRTPRIVMRYVDDDLAVELAALAAKGIHDPSTMPFSIPWTDAAPGGELERESLQWFWRGRAELKPVRWDFNLAVICDGIVVGTGGLVAEDFPTMRSIETGSWLGREYQGQGIGKELRAASLHLIFAGFDADYATTGAWHDNAASLGVTRALGYTEVGRRRARRRDKPDTLVGFEMPRRHWETIRRDDIEVIGIDAVREQLGTARPDLESLAKEGDELGERSAEVAEEGKPRGA